MKPVDDCTQQMSDLWKNIWMINGLLKSDWKETNYTESKVVMSQMSQWVMSQWVRSEKIKVLVETIKFSFFRF